jgi:hypothetical protein
MSVEGREGRRDGGTEGGIRIGCYIVDTSTKNATALHSSFSSSRMPTNCLRAPFYPAQTLRSSLSSSSPSSDRLDRLMPRQRRHHSPFSSPLPARCSSRLILLPVPIPVSSFSSLLDDADTHLADVARRWKGGAWARRPRRKPRPPGPAPPVVGPSCLCVDCKGWGGCTG